MALLWFTVRAAGTLLGPFLILTAFLAFAPQTFGAHQSLVLVLSIGVGLVAGYPRTWDAKAVGLRVVYTVVMAVALAWWTLLAVASFLPNAGRYLKFDF